MDHFEFENKKKRKLKKEPIYIGLCVICLMIGLVGGYTIQSLRYRTQDLSLSVYDEVSELIENNFLDTTDSDYSLQERMLNGMVAGLGDRHSSYLSTSQAEELGTTINGSFVGIGVTFTMVHAGALILDVYQGTPAYKAGMKKGDIILQIEGTSIASYSSDKVKDTIRGEEGTDVALHILRNGKEMDIQCTRQGVETSVECEIRENNIGYLRITTFGESTASLIETALKNFKVHDVENIVIDLRGNGGGYLEAARAILNLFIPQNEVLFKVVSKQGKETVYKADDCEKYMFQKGCVLIDGNTASASEVMTSALKELLGYTLIGETTYGKGTVQTQAILSNASTLKYTYAKWLTAKGMWVNEKGIAPDEEVDSVTLDDFHVVNIEKELKYDQVDDTVLYMQEMLKELNYTVDREDGYFSQETQNALKAFEKDYGLDVDGIYDQDDATILLSALAHHVYENEEDQQYLKAVDLMK